MIQLKYLLALSHKFLAVIFATVAMYSVVSGVMSFAEPTGESVFVALHSVATSVHMMETKPSGSPADVAFSSGLHY